MDRLLGFLTLAFFVYCGIRLLPYLFAGVVEGINLVGSEPKKALAFVLGLLFIPYLFVAAALPLVAGLIFFAEAGRSMPSILGIALWGGGIWGAVRLWRATVYPIRVRLNPSVADSEDGI